MTEFIPGSPRIACDVKGEGPLVVFLHGIGGNRSNWAEQVAHIGQHARAVAWDARGYGESEDDPREGPPEFADFSADLLRLIGHFGADRAHVVGLSMGGRIAMDFAVRHPGRVASLVLADTHLGFGNFSEEERAAFIRLREEPLRAGQTMRDLAPAVAKTLMGDDAGPAIEKRLVESMAAIKPENYLRSIACMVNSDRFDALEAIAAPTLVLAGGADRLTPLEMAYQIAARIPGARCMQIHRAGHLSNIEAPLAFNMLLDAFLPL